MVDRQDRLKNKAWKRQQHAERVILRKDGKQYVFRRFLDVTKIMYEAENKPVPIHETHYLLWRTEEAVE